MILPAGRDLGGNGNGLRADPMRLVLDAYNIAMKRGEDANGNPQVDVTLMPMGWPVILQFSVPALDWARLVKSVQQEPESV